MPRVGNTGQTNLAQGKPKKKKRGFLGRFWKKDFKDRVEKDRDIRQMDEREAKTHAKGMKKIKRSLKDRLKNLLGRRKRGDARAKTDDNRDNREIRRIRDFQHQVSRQRRVAKYIAKQVKRFRPPKGTEEEAQVPKNTQAIDRANLALLEAAQQVRYPRNRGDKREMVQREFGGGVDDIHFYNRKGESRFRQGVELAPWDPGFAKSNRHADLKVHTHPERRDLKWPIRHLQDPRRKSRISDKTLALAAKGDKRAVATLKGAWRKQEKANQQLLKIQQDVRSISMDDRPSGGDVVNAMWGEKKPSLIATPRRNILMQAGKGATNTATLGKDERKKLNRQLRDEIDAADDFAWRRSKAGEKAKSVAELKQRVKKYQHLREQAIAAAIEKKVGVKVKFSKKGKKVKFPKKKEKK